MKRWWVALVLAGLACATVTPTPVVVVVTATAEAPVEHLPTPPTNTPAPTRTPTETATSSPTPTASATPTVTPTPTPAGPYGIVSEEMAFCRYGPGTAYLYSHGLAAGDFVAIDGKNATGTWLWVKPWNLERHCWAAKSVMEVTGDLAAVNFVTTTLPYSSLYGPPGAVAAKRDGPEVDISWNKVNMTEDDDRGYLLELYVCQNGAYIFLAAQTYETHYTVVDEPGCPLPSSGLLYTVEKHGYSDPLVIPWP
jgi:hypothetical protein